MEASGWISIRRHKLAPIYDVLLEDPGAARAVWEMEFYWD
jgi:hypothetical protein